MARRNRVTPTGDIVATPERGTVMGNRGVLHDADGDVRRAWQLERWIVCVLAFRGRRRQVMTPGRYTELFFLDEATALAAGHRPCAECRRGRFDAFRRAWAADKGSGGSLPTASEIDGRLHAERVAPDGTQRTFAADLDGLPDGVFVRHPDLGETAYLVWGSGLLAWSAGGYPAQIARPSGLEVRVLTPASTVGAIRAGYTPDLHPTAQSIPGNRMTGFAHPPSTGDRTQPNQGSPSRS
jgi:hypothetical protein